MIATLALLSFSLSAHETPRVLPLAEAALGAQPVSLTAVVAPDSPGGPQAGAQPRLPAQPRSLGGSRCRPCF